ncbi:MAG: CsbD family protein [Nitrospiraceae bacterium]|nr:MAG: CsbD family protein [Nitrospiraceae bacterium]
MNAEILKGKWKEIKGEVKTKWGKLTDDDLTTVEGNEEKLLGLLQQRYGYARDKAEQDYKEFMDRYVKTDSTKR